MDATIYHNPRCSTSRKALELMREAGIEPKIVEYLKDPPSRTRLKQLIKKAGLGVREAMRSKEPVFAELGLGNPKLSDEQLLEAMVANPILIERPIVETAKGVRLARPIEKVREIL
jgi:arsenate reductase